jgi:hypothetical protein
MVLLCKCGHVCTHLVLQAESRLMQRVICCIPVGFSLLLVALTKDLRRGGQTCASFVFCTRLKFHRIGVVDSAASSAQGST